MTPAAVLFDCDGVIVDSEGIISRILAEEISRLGWIMTAEEEQRTFQGMTGAMLAAVVAERVGPLPEDWSRMVGQRLRAALEQDMTAVPHIGEAIAAIVAAGIPIACASNSSRRELHRKLGWLGLTAVFGDRVFSHQDVAQPKPAPDIYLAAAASCGADPAHCVVVEDTVMGARAGLAAGCRVLGYGHDSLHIFAALPSIEVFSDMRELPGLLGIAAPVIQNAGEGR